MAHASSIGPDPTAIGPMMEKYGGLMAPAAGILENEGVQGAPVLRSIGKRIDELLDAVFTTPKGSGLPKRLKLTGWDARTNQIEFHAPAGERFQASPQQLDKLIGSGSIDLEQPAAGAVSSIQSRLSKALPKP